MKLIWKAANVAALIAATILEFGCGDTYRPVATPSPTTSSNPAGAETVVVLNQCPSGATCVNNNEQSSGSVLTAISVSGDSNMGNLPVGQVVGATGFLVDQGAVTAGGVNVGVTSSTSTVLPDEVTVAPVAFDYLRTSAFTANTSSDTASKVTLATSTGSFSTTVTQISLDSGAKPMNVAFQYYGSGTQTYDYIVNSGTTASNCSPDGTLAQLTQSTGVVSAAVCVGTSPVAAWIYKDFTKVFVLDYNDGYVYVVDAANHKYSGTKIQVGTHPIKVAQSNDGRYLYVVNYGDGTSASPSTVSVIDAVNEDVVQTVAVGGYAACGSTPVLCSTLSTPSPVIDVAQDMRYGDTTSNTQVNHVWLLHANGSVSVWDGTTPGELTWYTTVRTLTDTQLDSSYTSNGAAYPTNLALMLDGTYAYVGVGNTDKVAAIDTSKLTRNAITTGAEASSSSVANAVTTITNVGNHHSQTESMDDDNGTAHTVTLETTTPVVTYVAVSRTGDSTALSKAYASTVTSTVYYDCTSSTSTVNCVARTPIANLYNGTAVISAASISVKDPLSNSTTTTPANTYITTIDAPDVVTYCTPTSTDFDAQKECPKMIPTLIIGRS